MNKNPYLLPISIVVAGIVIAGAIMYKPGPRVAEVVEPIDYVELAGTLGMDTVKFKACIENRTFEKEVDKDLADGIAAKVSGTPTSFINGKAVEGAADYATYKAVIDEALKKGPVTGGPSVDDDAVLGSATAPVTMIVFGDFQCPFCARAHETAEKQVRKEYVDTGKVKMVFRDFPLNNIHPAAQPAAEASECAHAQGKYWEYHDALFANQERLP